jgi:hypothetical protein
MHGGFHQITYRFTTAIDLLVNDSIQDSGLQPTRSLAFAAAATQFVRRS